MWKTGDPEIATPKRVRTYRPKHSDTSLSHEWRINMANKKRGGGLATCALPKALGGTNRYATTKKL